MNPLTSVTIPALTTAQIASLTSGLGSGVWGSGSIATCNTASLPSFNMGSTYTVNTNGAVGSTYTSNNTWHGIGSTASRPGSLQVSGDAEFEGDVKIKGVSIAKALADIQKRLAILVPDPAKLEHFEALKKAYDHYKLLEALCELPTKETKE